MELIIQKHSSLAASTLALIRSSLAVVATAIVSLFLLFSMIILPKQRAWEFWLRCWCKTLLHILGVKVLISGRENIGQRGIYIMNHESIVDILSLPLVAPKQASFIAKQELRSMPFVGLAMQKAGCIFINRKSSKDAIESIREGLREMPEGYSIFIFPEGTRSEDTQIRVFKKGAFHIAKQLDLPIIPVVQVGCAEIALGRQWVCKPGNVHLQVGAPIWVTERADAEASVCLEEIRQKMVAMQSASPLLTKEVL